MKKYSRIYGLQTIEMIVTNHPSYLTKLMVQVNTQNKRVLAIVQQARECGVAVEEVNNLGKHSRKENAALLAECRALPVLDEVALKSMLTAATRLTLVVLDGITDPHNLGAILRSCAALDVNAVIVPRNNSVGLTPTVRSVACGGAEIVPFVQVSNLSRTLRMLKDAGIWVYGASGQAQQELSSIKFPMNIAIVFGSEHDGMKRMTTELCDELVKIPLWNDVDSLNVSVAAGIFIYQMQAR